MAAYSQAVYLQDLIILRSKQEELTDMALAALARAWDVLEDRKRILRNRPLPGQLRPDLDPVQMQRMLKRAKARQPIEMITDAHVSDGPGPEPKSSKAQIVASTPQDVVVDPDSPLPETPQGL